MSVKVLIVDDSAVVRKVLSEMLAKVVDIEVIGTAQDPIFARKRMDKEWPDVILLDVEMPRMDGITFLKQIMAERPTPVVMCSTLTEEGSRTSLEALRSGAIEVIAKPKTSVKTSLAEASRELIAAIRTAAKANMTATKVKPIISKPVFVPKVDADAMLKKVQNTDNFVSKIAFPLVAIGASTGGTQALEAVLSVLPGNIPPILIVQHMPEQFTKAFAKRLDQVCTVEVKEAEDNDLLLPGRVLIAPGGRHMMLQVTKFGASVQVKDGPAVSRHKPSVDVLFRSVAKYAGNKALGIIMTGMGDDGARGIKEMHEVKAKTVAQDEASCVVYGMPQEAVKLGAIEKVVPLDKIPELIVAHS